MHTDIYLHELTLILYTDVIPISLFSENVKGTK